MNCRDFNHVWNRLLDDEPRSRRRFDAQFAATRLELESRLREHAAACETCRVRHCRFETLQRALRAWAVRPPAPSPSSPLLAERVLRAVAPRRRRARVVASTLAAAVVAAVAIGFLKPPLRPDAEIKPPPTVAEPATESSLLRAAVNNATAASWQLARLTTEPAARLGREMIDASFPTREPPVLELALLEPSPTPATDSDSFAPELFSRMGGYLTAGVQPVSTSAREAFGFLRPPTPR